MFLRYPILHNLCFHSESFCRYQESKGGLERGSPLSHSKFRNTVVTCHSHNFMLISYAMFSIVILIYISQNLIWKH